MFRAVRTWPDRTVRAAAIACAAAALAAAHAAPAAEPARWRPAVAAEIGRGDDTDMLRLALAAEQAAPLWSRETLSLAAFGEIAAAHWRFPQPNAAGRRHITVVGVTPYLRLRDTRIGRWFFDFGIGLNALSDLYETRDRRFSTRFQFSDHLAFGRGFGDGDALELSYRFIHFSNAGIRRPNPGLNFHVLRLQYRFR
jgi:lipid A 3-O-deacylase